MTLGNAVIIAKMGSIVMRTVWVVIFSNWYSLCDLFIYLFIDSGFLCFSLAKFFIAKFSAKFYSTLLGHILQGAKQAAR